MIMNKERITVTEAAQRLGVSSQTVRSLIRQGELMALRVGRKFLIALSEIEHFIVAHTSKRQ